MTIHEHVVYRQAELDNLIGYVSSDSPWIESDDTAPCPLCGEDGEIHLTNGPCYRVIRVVEQLGENEFLVQSALASESPLTWRFLVCPNCVIGFTLSGLS